MTVGPLAPVQPIEFAALPKFGFLLQQTFGGPARVFVQQTGGGVELIIEALPIEVLFPDGLLLPFEPAAGDVTQGAFDPAQPDTYEIALRAAGRQQPEGVRQAAGQRDLRLRARVRHARVGRPLPILGGRLCRPA